MAKYIVKHSCGHTQRHEIFGPVKDRERKIAWLATQECKDCWIAEQREERKRQPLTAEVIYNPFSEGVWLAVTSGDTYSIKEQLKSIGCSYREYHDNSDFLGFSKPKKAWMIQVNPDDVEETTKIVQKLYDLGVTKIVDTTNPLGASIAARLEFEKSKSE